MDSDQTPPASFPPPPVYSSYSSPPPIIAPRPNPPPRRSRGWMIFALVLLAMLVVSVLLNFGQLVSRFGRVHRTAGPRLEEVLLEDERVPERIAVIDVDGIISGSSIDQGGATMVDLFKAELDRAKDDDRVRAVVLRVDSPGGEVLASDDMYRAIADFQKVSGKSITASMGNLAASGGYYISSPCHWIVANELTITGSIGVIMHTWNYRGLMTKVGLKPIVYKSGKHKDMLSGERDPEEIPADEVAMVQSLIDQTFNRFKKVVGDGRRDAHEKNKDTRALAGDWQSYADGRILSGTQAFQLGFVDQLGDFQDAVRHAKETAGLSRATLVKYQQRLDLADLLHLFGKSEAPVIKVDLGVETPKLEAGRLYFLSPTFLH